MRFALGAAGSLPDTRSLGHIIDEAHDVKPFGQHDSNHQMRIHQCQLLVGDCFLKKQREGVRKLLFDELPDGDFEYGFLGVRRSWDEATVRMYPKSEDHMEAMLQSLDLPQSVLQIRTNKRLTVAVSVLQQRAFVARNMSVSPVYLPGRFIDGCTASKFFSSRSIGARAGSCLAAQIVDETPVVFPRSFSRLTQLQ